MRFLVPWLLLLPIAARAELHDADPFLGGIAFAADRERFWRPDSHLCSLVPAFRNGRVIGIKLFSIRPGALPGIQSGDTLQRFGFAELSTPGAALDSYEAVRRSRWLDVDFEHRGRPLTIVWVFDAFCLDPAWEIAAGLIPEPICR